MQLDPRTPEQFLKDIKEIGCYMHVKQLPDGSVAAVGSLLTTRAIYLGCTLWGWERRFCYRDMDALYTAFDALVSENDEPTGWIARRPEQPCGR